MQLLFVGGGVIDLFSLNILFSQFRPHDVLKRICLLPFISHAHICTWIARHLKGTVLWGNITRSAIEKQNIKS